MKRERAPFLFDFQMSSLYSHLIHENSCESCFLLISRKKKIRAAARCNAHYDHTCSLHYFVRSSGLKLV